MVVGICSLVIYLPFCHSLKEKRRVLRSLKDRLRSRHNISIAEVNDQDEWTLATMGITAAGSDIPQINSLLDRVLNTLQDWREARLADHRIEIFSPQ